MRIPLVILACLAVVGGLLGIPYALLPIGTNPNALERWLEPVFAPALSLLGKVPVLTVHWEEYLAMLVATGISAAGIALAWRLFVLRGIAGEQLLEQRLGTVYTLLCRKYYLDEAYQKGVVEPVEQLSERVLWRILDVGVIDGFVNGIALVVGRFGAVLRRLQTGIAQTYAMLMLAGILALLSWLVLF